MKINEMREIQLTLKLYSINNASLHILYIFLCNHIKGNWKLKLKNIIRTSMMKKQIKIN